MPNLMCVIQLCVFIYKASTKKSTTQYIKIDFLKKAYYHTINYLHTLKEEYN